MNNHLRDKGQTSRKSNAPNAQAACRCRPLLINDTEVLPEATRDEYSIPAPNRVLKARCRCVLNCTLLFPSGARRTGAYKVGQEL